MPDLRISWSAFPWMAERGAKEECSMNTDSRLSRRSLLANVSAAAAVIGPAVPAALSEPLPNVATTSGTSGADPIFAAIEAHKQANLDRKTKIDRMNADLEKLGPCHSEEDAPSYRDQAAASEREGETFRAFWRTMPTTAAGAAAVFRYLQEPRWPPDAGPPSDFPGENATIVQDAVSSGWQDSSGDGGIPSVMQWAQMMELALQRIAAGA
jgi:hypothetical protein